METGIRYRIQDTDRERETQRQRLEGDLRHLRFYLDLLDDPHKPGGN